MTTTASPSAPPPSGTPSGPILDVENIHVQFAGRVGLGAGLFGKKATVARAVDGVSLQMQRGEILALAGESGCGKTTTARAVMGLERPQQGTILYKGEPIWKDLRAYRRRVQMVFQDPTGALNPRQTIYESVAEGLRIHKVKGDEREQVAKALSDAGLRPPERFFLNYPHELSGGQRQRVGIARALSLGPELLVADEPTSALDVSVQAHVLELFKDLQAQYGFACLFISHDLAVVEILAKQIAVLHRGKLAETGSRERILRNPQDPYTKRLLAAAPVPDPTEQGIRREERRALLAAGADQDDAVPFNPQQWDPGHGTGDGGAGATAGAP
jgi:peptide/nickel transport system ATP-binding protein